MIGCDLGSVPSPFWSSLVLSDGGTELHQGPYNSTMLDENTKTWVLEERASVSGVQVPGCHGGQNLYKAPPQTPQAM